MNRHVHFLALVAALLAGLTVLAGCTGIPTQSLPQTVESVDVGGPPSAVSGPQKNLTPRQLLLSFLPASTSDPVKHSTAREYLTPAARNRWSDNTVTIIADENVGNYDSAKGTVTVTGRKIGTLDSNGVYTPTLDGVGHGGTTIPFFFGIQFVHGQYLISSLNPGLLLTEQQFRSNYFQRTLYFFDTSERYLVPDLRYSPLIDSNQASGWMLQQLVQGPRQSLTGVVNVDPLATQSQRISVKITGSRTTVQLPGSRQLGEDVRSRLAAQVSTTLYHAFGVKHIALVDGERAVVIPGPDRTQFQPDQFSNVQGPTVPPSAIYYVRSGRIRTQSGKLLPGPLANDSIFFDSVALARPSAISELAVAGVQKVGGGRERMVVGTQSSGVRAVDLPAGRLTRPAWFPGRAEVWIGDGAKLYRVTVGGRTNQVAQIPVPSLAGGGRLVAVRPSPDGSQVALVIEGVNNQPQLYIGGVVRTGSTVQLEAATRISPSGSVITDVAWIDPLKLYAIGYQAQSKDSEVYRANVDGALWTEDGIGTLPNPPDSITMTLDEEPWVSTEGLVWELNGNTWVSPVSTSGQTQGTNPIYLG